MPSVSTTVYTCDRDGYVSEPSTTGLPQGWSTLSVTTMPVTPPPPPADPAVAGSSVPPPSPMMLMPKMVGLMLCPACTGELTTFTSYKKR
jgi:hypothetical protein